VPHYSSLCIFKPLNFEQSVAAFPFITALWIFNHYTFPFSTADFVHKLLKVNLVFAGLLLNCLHDIVWLLSQFFSNIYKSLCKSAFYQRCIKDHEHDTLPVIWVGRLVSNDRDNILEVIATGPQFTVECHFRQVSLPFLRCIYDAARASVQTGSIPVTADTIHFLAHKPARRIMFDWIVGLSEHDLN